METIQMQKVELSRCGVPFSRFIQADGLENLKREAKRKNWAITAIHQPRAVECAPPPTTRL